MAHAAARSRLRVAQANVGLISLKPIRGPVIQPDFSSPRKTSCANDKLAIEEIREARNRYSAKRFERMFDDAGRQDGAVARKNDRRGSRLFHLHV